METNPSLSSWVERDLACIWHPFTQAQTAPPPIPIVRGQGSYLYSETGNAYLDAISSWWVNLHGHAHPYIAEKIAAQAKELEHVLFAGFTHPQAIVLAERLLSLFPMGYSRVFYSDNGSTSVEVALKMAFQVIGNGKQISLISRGLSWRYFRSHVSGRKDTLQSPILALSFPVHSILPPISRKRRRIVESHLRRH